MNILLQILDDGRITDARGKTVSFENTVIVMTTNAGSMGSSTLTGFTDNPDLLSSEKTERALSQFLRPEFLNRVDEVVTFRALSKEDFGGIAGIMMSDLKKVMAEKEIELDYTDDALALIAEKSYSAKFGARNMRRFIETEVEDRLASEIIRTKGELRRAVVGVKDGELNIASSI